MNTTLTNDLCNEVRDLRRLHDEARKLHAEASDLLCDYIVESRRRKALLTAVLDAGRPHSHLCDCDQCNAWLAVRKELRGE